jgi:hypothetical protein
VAGAASLVFLSGGGAAMRVVLVWILGKSVKKV